MTEEEIFQQYRGRRVLVDANLLLLFFIGSFQRSRVSTFKRTAHFTLAEFDALSALLAQFQIVVTTPHVLTEVSNLANSLPEHVKDSWADHFAAKTTALLEILEPATKVMQASSFNPFGLTDAAIHSIAADTLVLTEDFRLSGFLGSQGVSTLNFRSLARTFDF